ncbi:MAG: hypothetical protein OEO82_02845 [Gammaproteobacteria bacterium]|nr:hypothetical protein [Gammaproteobacteria bacterium]
MSVVQKFIRARLALAVAAAIPLAGGTALAFENGPPPGFTGGSGDPDCTVCHFDYAANTPGGTLTVAGLPDAFVAGERYLLTIAVTHPDLKSGGFQLAVRDNNGGAAGDLYAESDGVQTIYEATTDQTYAQHNQRGAEFTRDHSVEWQVTWEAPGDINEVIVNAAANASNADGSPLGDRIYSMARQLSVAGTAAALEAEDVDSAPDQAAPVLRGSGDCMQQQMQGCEKHADGGCMKRCGE